MIGLEMTEPMMVSAVMIDVLRQVLEEGDVLDGVPEVRPDELARPEDGRIGHQIFARLERGGDHPVEGQDEEGADEDQHDPRHRLLPELSGEPGAAGCK